MTCFAWKWERSINRVLYGDNICTLSRDCLFFKKDRNKFICCTLAEAVWCPQCMACFSPFYSVLLLNAKAKYQLPVIIFELAVFLYSEASVIYVTCLVSRSIQTFHPWCSIMRFVSKYLAQVGLNATITTYTLAEGLPQVILHSNHCRHCWERKCSITSLIFH